MYVQRDYEVVCERCYAFSNVNVVGFETSTVIVICSLTISVFPEKITTVIRSIPTTPSSKRYYGRLFHSGVIELTKE